MHAICAWCGVSLNIREEPNNDFPVSHGICDDCTAKFLSEDSVSLQEFIDRLKPPVFCLDSEGRVITANRQAAEALGKPLESIQLELGGDVMECSFATLPGGCGKTVHCKACTIRRNVEATHATHMNLTKVPATLTTNIEGHPAKVRYLISTEWTPAGVLLQIDEVTGIDQIPDPLKNDQD